MKNLLKLVLVIVVGAVLLVVNFAIAMIILLALGIGFAVHLALERIKPQVEEGRRIAVSSIAPRD